MLSHRKNIQQWHERHRLNTSTKSISSDRSQIPKKIYLRVFFDLMDISYVKAFIVYTKYMQDKFPYSARLKTLKNFKHDVVMDLIGKFSSRKRARSSSTEVSRFSSDGSDIHQVTPVPYQDRGKCKLCTKRKIDSRMCTRCDDCNLFLCQTSKKIVSGNGTLVLRATF